MWKLPDHRQLQFTRGNEECDRANLNTSEGLGSWTWDNGRWLTYPLIYLALWNFGSYLLKSNVHRLLFQEIAMHQDSMGTFEAIMLDATRKPRGLVANPRRARPEDPLPMINHIVPLQVAGELDHPYKSEYPAVLSLHVYFWRPLQV